MPEAAVVRIGKAVESQIRTAMESSEFGTEFVLERSYADWEFNAKDQDGLELSEGEKLRVDVVGHMTEQTTAAETRGGKVDLIVPVDIAIRRKLIRSQQDSAIGERTVEQIDDLMLLVQQIYLMFKLKRLTGFVDAVWDGENGGTKILVAPDRRHLRDLRQFTAIIRVYFKTVI